MNRTFLLLLVLFSALCVSGTFAADGKQPAEPTILVVGDSLSAGFGLRPGESWVSLLETRLDAKDFPHDVVNASISGDTSRGALARLPRALDVHDPDIVIIEIGGNDGLRGLPLEELRGNLVRMIELSRESGANVLLLAIRLPENYGPQYTGQFRRLYLDLAAAQGVPVARFMREEVALNPELMQDDGVHPNAAAQPVLLDYVWSELESMLEGEATAGTRHAAEGQ